MAMLSSELALLLLLPRSESDTDAALPLLQSAGRAPSCELRLLLGVVGRLVRLSPSLDGEGRFFLLPRRLQAGSTSDRWVLVGATLFRRCAATADGCDTVVVADQSVPE